MKIVAEMLRYMFFVAGSKPPMMLDQGTQCELESLLPYMTSPDDDYPDSPRSLQEPVLPSDTDTDCNQR